MDIKTYFIITSKCSLTQELIVLILKLINHLNEQQGKVLVIVR